MRDQRPCPCRAGWTPASPESAGVARAGAGDRDVVQILQRVQPVLRRLGRDGVADAGLRIQPEGRRRLAAAAERDQQVVGDVALGEPASCALGAIDVDVQLRLSKGCWMRRSADARDHAGAGCSSWSANRRLACRLSPDHLDVDRRRQPEVQDLADDVGGKERERRRREIVAPASGADRGCTRRSAGDPGVSATRMSASPGPIGAELLYERLSRCTAGRCCR